ncbi:MAG TPA: hypothetical protein VMX97_06735 [Hyphomicrobiaceae bacterium]|nr:hypothetical protein [Hyphomicrobiaceae bacterium]
MAFTATGDFAAIVLAFFGRATLFGAAFGVVFFAGVFLPAANGWAGAAFAVFLAAVRFAGVAAFAAGLRAGLAVDLTRALRLEFFTAASTMHPTVQLATQPAKSMTAIYDRSRASQGNPVIN